MDRDQPFERMEAGPRASHRANRADHCPRCGRTAPLIYVHGHAQCSACGSNILDCCQGSECDLAPQR